MTTIETSTTEAVRITIIVEAVTMTAMSELGTVAIFELAMKEVIGDCDSTRVLAVKCIFLPFT